MKSLKSYLNTILLILILLVGVGLLFSIHSDNNSDNDLYSEDHHGQMESITEEASKNIPTMPGQEAFGTIQEIIGILEADPNTDWKSVHIDALLAHLIDMDEVTMHTSVQREELPNGLKMIITGEGRTIDSIKRMVPTHNAMTLTSFDKWKTEVEIIDDGAVLTVTSDIEEEVDKIRGLDFIGIMSVSSNHQPHHLMIAKGMTHMLK